MRNTFVAVVTVIVSSLCVSMQAGNPQLPKLPNLPSGSGSNMSNAQLQQIMQLRALQSRGGGSSRGPQRGADPQIINNSPGLGPASNGAADPVVTGNQKAAEKRAQAKRLKAEQKKLAKDAKDAEKKSNAKSSKVAKDKS